ncbi:hypothetical protein A0H81_00921 [Grifola frondosa]|uniref:Uncharacterized protein n=1 Tax=Grifola frondosa TaxID=5627 RepID=A0A1C7MQP6_GRIFR|nr:hypothetical protein A0H81_00921 [Grifola frondosa]
MSFDMFTGFPLCPAQNPQDGRHPGGIQNPNAERAAAEHSGRQAGTNARREQLCRARRAGAPTYAVRSRVGPRAGWLVVGRHAAGCGRDDRHSAELESAARSDVLRTTLIKIPAAPAPHICGTHLWGTA